MNQMNLKEFIDHFQQEIIIASESSGALFDREDFLSLVMLDFLEEIGEVSDPIIANFRSRGLQMSGYALSDDFESIDIYVSRYVEFDENPQIPPQEVDASFRRAMQIFRKAVVDLHKDFEQNNDAHEFAKVLYNHRAEIMEVRIIFLTNGLVKKIDIPKINLEGTDFSFIIWDLERLYRCISSGKMHEAIAVDFEQQFGQSIECIENSSSDIYRIFLAMIPGTMLADIYEIYGPRLLERNVRSFLHLKGAVNSGIHKTLKDTPEMFLAYNNGISVTAEKVEIKRDQNGKPSITKIYDMQIVNGGQTTASIHNARNDARFNADLSKVYVQMKITEICDSSKMDEIVPDISFFANTQNKVQLADFSANDPFHRKVEQLSRTIWTPITSGNKPLNWFYERSRGQYADMLISERTPARQKIFKEQHPLLNKTDLAKYENTWDQLPHFVSEGAQKNFKRFTVRLAEKKGFVPDVHYYENLIAKTILFRQAESVIARQDYGGYRANIVTYTIALLSFRTAQRIDLSTIWKEQKLSQVMLDEIIRASRYVWKIITEPPRNGNIGEWCKNVKCWEMVRNCEFEIDCAFERELVAVDKPIPGSRGRDSITESTEEEKENIAKTMSIPAEKWFALSHWAKETNNLSVFHRKIVFTVGTYVNRNRQVSPKQAFHAMKAMEEAVEKGFK